MFFWLTFFFLISQLASCMLDKHIPLVCTSFKIYSWNVPDNEGGRFSCYHIPIRLVCNLLWNNFHFNTMSVALLAVNFFL